MIARKRPLEISAEQPAPMPGARCDWGAIVVDCVPIVGKGTLYVRGAGAPCNSD